MLDRWTRSMAVLSQALHWSVRSPTTWLQFGCAAGPQPRSTACCCRAAPQTVAVVLHHDLLLAVGDTMLSDDMPQMSYARRVGTCRMGHTCPQQRGFASCGGGDGVAPCGWSAVPWLWLARCQCC